MLHTVQAGEYTIIHNDHDHFVIPTIEARYKAKYIGEFTLKAIGGGWVNMPVAVFYQEAIPAAYKDVGSHWFGLYYNPNGQAMITNAKTAVDHDWTGVLNPTTKEILYSAYRHDYQTHGELMADGGPDYTRSSAHPHVKLRIVKDTLEVSDGEAT